ncbi:hypothetical protein Noda2021_07550 [Candidatus Dependentiae bacterium Noda2021]|nr:hypothetical protein Noda2021_07550 [Candidatus Dependentiae bacterium Noda2021]
MRLYVNFFLIFFMLASYRMQALPVQGQINAIALQVDAKIVATGYDNNATVFQTARYNQDGSLDEAFGSGGFVSTLIGDSCQATSIAIQPDGKIVVAGFSISSNVQIALARYNLNGEIDTTFGTGGIVTTPVGDGATANAMVLQPDGNIVICGVAIIGGIPNIVVARYDATGLLDSTFGVDGITTTLIDSTSTAYSIALQDDDKIVVGGLAIDSGNTNFAVARYTTDGALDITSFGSGNGYVTTTITGSDIIRAIAIQSDGNIVAYGYSSSTPNSICIARYTTSGVLDSSFGTAGIVTTTQENGLFSFGGLVQTDGAIAATGSLLSVSRTEKFATVRYLTDGTLDTTFGSSGIVVATIGENAGTRAIVQQVDNKIVVAGYSQFNGIIYFTLARYLLDGTLDQTFGSGGIAGPNQRSSCCTGNTGPAGSTGPEGAQGVQGTTGNTGPSAAATDYVFSYDTTNQSVAIASSFQNINFSTNQVINNWTHSEGSATFTCPTDGTYLVTYRLLANNTSVSAQASTISVRALLNGTEISGSQASISLGQLVGQLLPVHQSFLVTCAASDEIVLQFTGTTTNNQITANNGSGITRPSATLTISKL